MNIKDQLYAINDRFEQLHIDFSRFEAERADIDSRYAAKASAVKAQYQQNRQSINEIKNSVLTYYRIAKDSSRRDLVRSGIPGQRPDIAKLNSLIDKVDLNDRNDAIADQIIDLASAYLVYLDNEIAKIDSEEQMKLKRLESGKLAEDRSIMLEKKGVLDSCARYLGGNDVANLVRLFEEIRANYELTDDCFKQWDTPKKRKRMMLIGFSQFPVDIPKKLCGTFKQHLGHYFDERKRTVNCPCGFTTTSHEDIYIEYTDLNETLANSGVQALVLNTLRYFKPNEYKVSLFDYIHFNANVLGSLSAASGIKNGVIDNIAFDDETLRQNAVILASYYRQVEARIGAQSVYEYNAARPSSERIPYRIIIINRIEELFRANESPEMSYVLNNAEKLGVTVVHMTKSQNGGSKGTKQEQQYLSHAKDSIKIISDVKGGFYIEDDVRWMPFQWLEAPSPLPADFIAKLRNAMTPKVVGNKYFKRYKIDLPKKQIKRKSIVVPFAINEDDKPVSCSFDNENFAAYVMGAAGSGKSSLLHTLICGLLMNYHPDEVELWLMDFNMVEFQKYAIHRPPHVRYLLLENSEDLVFDILDKLSQEIERRQYLFAQNKWENLKDVSADSNLPAIFVIIDEFARMSQILKETKGAGKGADYALKLEDMLRVGRKFGIKFIFSSQTYTTGVSGLTETACKQIQMRFAMKNTQDEIKQTLMLSSEETTPGLSRDISSLPVHETLFKWRDEQNNVKVGRFKNMYAEADEIENLLVLLSRKFHPVPYGSKTDDNTFIDKDPVFVDGNTPKTFVSQIPYYKDFECHMDKDDLNEEDVLIYPGVPCSFNLARPFVMYDGTAENILIAGGSRDSEANLAASILKCYSRTDNSIEIWAHPRSSIYRKYKDTVPFDKNLTTDVSELCARISCMKEDVLNHLIVEKIIVCFGLERLFSDFEIMGDSKNVIRESRVVNKNETKMPDMAEILACTDPDKKQKMIAAYNASLKADVSGHHIPENESQDIRGVYDARPDFEWLIKRAPYYGVHFLACFEQAQDFLGLRIDERLFRHKILFPMSRDDSIALMGSRRANEIGDGTCVYSNGKDCFSMRPHIHRGIPCDGWLVDEQGEVARKGPE